MNKSTKRRIVCLGAFGLLAAGFFAVVGCGPTRKEYAINEALLIDQTRALEDRLYRAHFQIQRLERENKELRERLEAKGEKVESDKSQKSAVPFDETGAKQTTMTQSGRRGTAANRVTRTAAAQTRR